MSRRRPEVTETRFHPKGCACGGDECIARQIKLDVSAVDAPGLARCDGDEAEQPRAAVDLAAARRGGAR